MRSAVLLAALALAACDVGGVTCTTEAIAAVSVRVFDAETGEPIACRATLTLTDGAFTETVAAEPGCGPFPDQASVAGAYERAGTYRVRVEVPGYAAWEQRDVRVEAGACHVRPALLEARLARLP